MTRRVEAKSTFGPVVLIGLASAGTLALAGSRPWAEARASDATTKAALAVTSSASGEVPLALALGLVVLACWGVLLVTRRGARRAMAGLGLLASLGALATVVVGRGIVISSLGEALTRAGAAPGDSHVDFTVWIWVAAVAAVLSSAAAAVALRDVGRWPEMSARYDAPSHSTELKTAAQDGEQQNLDLWKSIDEGRDPTL